MNDEEGYIGMETAYGRKQALLGVRVGDT